MIWCNGLRYFCTPTGKIIRQLLLILTKNWWKTSCLIKVLLRYVHNVSITAWIKHCWTRSSLIVSYQCQRLSFYFPSCPGCCIGISFNEANSLCTGYRETLTFWSKLWFCSTILYCNSRRLCHTCCSTGEHDKHKSPRRVFLAKRFWSCTFLLKASIPTQNTSGDITNSTKVWILVHQGLA